MIAGLRGALARWDEPAATAWVDVAGVIYEVVVPAFAWEWVAAHDEGAEIRFHTYYHVSERNPQPLLVGFPRVADRDFFRIFIEVPDVGPVKAVRALTHPVSEIARWVEAEDVHALQRLPGIGPRLAQTIVARLRGRLVEAALAPGEPSPSDRERAGGADGLRRDAVDALIALQYGRREAERLVDQVLRASPGLSDLEALLRSALEQQASRGGGAGSG
ncbi:MAG: Holliday junction ATP-dependent DNA helicase RuvA [Chloroflexi bacterium]|nr:Holliday junction ATP-dependent DNA helicase RuvA [Chloroflexota bacterium]